MLLIYLLAPMKRRGTFLAIDGGGGDYLILVPSVGGHCLAELADQNLRQPPTQGKDGIFGAQITNYDQHCLSHDFLWLI